MKKILIINGPNLNVLGLREPEIYGSATLADVENRIKNLAAEIGAEATFFQSNSESEIIETIQKAKGQIDGLIINPGAFTHTSIAIADAISYLATPTIEVHLSNIYARESFRHHSYIAPVVLGQIAGLGAEGYLLALRKLTSLPCRS